jgi:hypothetical protein
MTDDLWLDACNQTPAKRCPQCGKTKPLEEFVRNPTAADGRRKRCAICEVTNPTEPKRDRRERHKARDTRSRHARKYGHTIAHMETYYGWDLDRIETDILTVRDHGCPRCGEPVQGLPDIHVNIRKPTAPPFYGANTRVVCATCNKLQGPGEELDLDIADAERLAIARELERRPVDPKTGTLSLFDPPP